MTVSPESSAQVPPVQAEDVSDGALVTQRARLEETQRALLNILEDSSEQNAAAERVQRAMLNLLEDFDVERAKAEGANRDLRTSYEKLQLANAATEAANREIEAFNYSVSHDLRSPLRSVAGFSQLLLADYSGKLDDEGRDYLNRIAAAAERMGLLIDDLLKLSRLSRSAMERATVDLTAIARKILGRFRAAQPERSVETLVDEGITVYGDERLLTVVLENLLDNAWKFTQDRERPRIEFGAERIGDEIECFVRDNGAGFDMTYTGKLFQAFQRLHKVEEFPGTGIGLATVKRIIERHGGRVWIEGALNQGATAHFVLPRSPEEVK
jgi:light-regulated signal transduction histidine kinase (bacteriophytochrome)